MKRMRRVLLVLLVAGILTTGLWLAALSPGLAGGGACPTSYVVRYGDTLGKIAAQFGIDLARLIGANHVPNPNRIYAGQVLCIPVPNAAATSAQTGTTVSVNGQQTPAVSPETKPITTESRLDLVIEYTFSPGADPDARVWTLGKDLKAGKRLGFALSSGDVISTYTSPDEVRAASARASEPLFWIARSRSVDPFTYTLVLIGDWSPLIDMQMGFTRPMTDIVHVLSQEEISTALNSIAGDLPVTRVPVTDLLNPALSGVSLRAELVAADGSFVPFLIDAIDYQPMTQTAEIAYPWPGIAVHREPSSDRPGYHVYMVLTDDGQFGPPGEYWRPRCSRWRGGGWWLRLLYSWYGCR